MSSSGTMNGGWAEYQRLVLAELERHSKSLEIVNDKLIELKTELALIREDRRRIDHIQQSLDQQAKQIQRLANNNFAVETIKKYKKGIIVILLSILAIIVGPLVALLIHFFSAGNGITG